MNSVKDGDESDPCPGRQVMQDDNQDIGHSGTVDLVQHSTKKSIESSTLESVHCSSQHSEGKQVTVMMTPSTVSQSVMISPSTVSQSVMMSPSTVSQSVMISPSTVSQSVMMAPSTVSQSVMMAPSAASQSVMMSPSTVSQSVMMSPSTVSQSDEVTCSSPVIAQSTRTADAALCQMDSSFQDEMKRLASSSLHRDVGQNAIKSGEKELCAVSLEDTSPEKRHPVQQLSGQSAVNIIIETEAPKAPRVSQSTDARVDAPPQRTGSTGVSKQRGNAPGVKVVLLPQVFSSKKTPNLLVKMPDGAFYEGIATS